MNKLVIGLVLLAAATTGALANQRGPVQASVDGSERVASVAVSSEVSAREDGSFDGARVVPADRFGRYSYIIRFQEPSLARYEGGIEGLAATSPRVTGERLHTASDAKAAYQDFLASRHDNYLAQISQFARRSVEIERQFLNALNGIVVRLTPEEADRVAGLPFVAGIEVNRFDELLLDEGPALIGAPGFWDGDVIGDGNRGEGIIIGIIDSGFNHDHPSFAEVAEDGYIHTNPYGDGVFRGVCADPKADDYEDLCNNKLIGAYNLAEGSVTAEDTAASGHGTHVGSTAGGNPLADVVYPFQYLDLTVDLTGVAPRANLINYKVCEPLCSAAARIAAIDNAINDGVSVLNHSIGNGEPPWASSVSLAFLDANAAGIFVAASAGNSGPGPSTVASTGPWNAAVAASTHQRRLAFELDVTGGDQDIPVSSTSGPALTGPLAGDLAYAGDVGDGSNFEACVPFEDEKGEPLPVFDGVGALVRRGGCPFATKVNNAADAGATFVFIANNDGGLFGAGGLEATTIPSIAVGQTTGDDLIAAINGGTVGVSVEAIIDVDPSNADIMADFSSRGPAGYNHIAPTVTAPGVQILAASTEVNGDFNVLGGTSMSSPHVAGSAALLMVQNPDWTPTEVRSALALSANPNTLKEDGVTPSDPFDHGSGRINVQDAGSVGFVMDETIANFEAANPAEGGEPADLNIPSIQDSTCVENCSFQRTIRSVVDQPIDYVVTSDAAAGVTITVTPDSFTLNPGSTETLDIDIDVTGAPFEEWLFAEIQIEQAPAAVGSPSSISEDFEGDFPPAGWTVTNIGGDCDWTDNDTVGRPNFAGGNGLSAAADSDACGQETAMDSALVSPTFSVSGTTELSFLMSYRHLGSSRFDVEISTNGTDWDLLESFTSSVDGEGPGAFQTYDLSAYDGAQDAQVRFRYVSPAWNWWAQVDNVNVGEASAPLQIANAQMPLALISLAPKPTIAVSVEGLSATQQRDEVTQQGFSISNEGQLPLEWTLNELGPQGSPSPQVSGVIWDNPQLGSSGRINNFSIPDGTGIYQSDAFGILAPSSIETIYSAGFELGAPGITDFVWMVFEDAGGVPAGDPETSPEDAVWSFQAAIDAAGVTYDAGEMTLDLAAAGAPALDLEPGVYWLLVYPTVQTYSLGPNNLYAWFHGESVDTGRQIGPGGLSGFPADWVGAPEGRAFTLTGSIDCTSQFNPWTNVSPTSGALDPGTSEEVNVEFFATGLQEGTYRSGLCILSNDDDQPFTLLPVQLNVVNLPTASASIDAQDFSVEFGNSDSAEVVIRNDGLGELEFSVRGAGNAPAGSGLLYEQVASQTTSGTLAIYDLDGPETWAVQAAEDFTVPADRAWIVDRVVANGFYIGLINPTADVRVFFYEDDGGSPGAEIAAFDDLVPTTDDAGVLTIDLPQTVALAGGTYWVSVQPEMDFFVDGRWFWFQNSEQAGSPFHWRNPGGGYSTPEDCTDWNTPANCGFVNPDLSFQMFGTSEDVCDAVDAVPWLSVDPVSGTVAAEGGELPVSLMVDGSEALPGSYEATVCFDTNDGANPVLVVNVGMEVTGEAPDGIFQDRFEADE